MSRSRRRSIVIAAVVVVVLLLLAFTFTLMTPMRRMMGGAADALAGSTSQSYRYSAAGARATGTKGLSGFANDSASYGPGYAPSGNATAPVLPPGDRMKQRFAEERARPDDMRFRSYGVNPTLDSMEDPVSTFSVDVDSASYTVARAYLERGALPDPDAVRVEEFINRFDYGYAAGPDVFQLNAEGFPSPQRAGYQLLRLGLKARPVAPAERKPAHLVFVIDVSGSMEGENRLGLVKQALRLLVSKLEEKDRVSIVVYGTNARTHLLPTPATDNARILAAIEGLAAEGATNVQAGVQLGYQLAQQGFRKGGINRLIVCSDGVANNGVVAADEIFATVDKQATQGVTLSTVGFGMGSYNDVLMEKLAKEGEGSYAYVDRLEEARRIFVENLTGTLQNVAKDVKVQVKFDPTVVERYRLLGYENRRLTTADFVDDRVDAGEVGADHAVTALYEVKLRRRDAPLGTFAVRFKPPEGGESRRVEMPIAPLLLQPGFTSASGPTQLSFVSAAFAEKLRESYWVRNLSYAKLYGLWEGIPAALRAREEVRELGGLIQRAAALDHRRDRYEDVMPIAAMDFDRLP